MRRFVRRVSRLGTTVAFVAVLFYLHDLRKHLFLPTTPAYQAIPDSQNIFSERVGSPPEHCCQPPWSDLQQKRGSLLIVVFMC